ncbi:MAG: hypothetical protein A3E93_03125 [Candidatus Zambryskibacteria bacterium RIFCSPHIGHO2_12_FULL_43_12b]|nr:MAG: hypothetical protein A3E93_03125 [Candidatus Zambryskibacteria bacterium RIFCSPHIGHO2_12_FULL_43_12b]
MKLYSVIPLAKTLNKETLSYFGSDAIPLGALVSVPLRKKIGKGIVVDKHDITESKSQIRSSPYALRKIIKVESKHFLSQEFIEAAYETARFYATTTGSILEHLVPELILENTQKFEPAQRGTHGNLTPERLVVQADDEERFAHYRSFIRGQFARKHSVFFLLPTVEDIRKTKTILEKGIENYTFALHSKLNKKEFKKILDTIHSHSHPLLIIGTAPFLSVERFDLGSIILDKENSRGYKTQARPYFDMRRFALKLAATKGVPILLGDIVLSVETLWHTKNDEYNEFSPLKMRLLSSAKNLLVDMKNPPEDVLSEKKRKFRVLSPELEALIDRNKAENENLFIFSARKGLSPSTVCGDCGQIVTCKSCSAPVVLYSGKGEKENFFLCNKCGDERSAAERCKNCSSWKLDTLGIGIERVEEEIKKRFPNVVVFRIDKDAVKSEKKAQDTISRFENSPGSVLLGTELGLFYLKKPVESVAVASIDSLFSIPDFRINEKIFYNLISMRDLARQVFLIQTRNADSPLFDFALKGNIIDYYKREIEDRKNFSYPPFSFFIKISTEGKRAQTEASSAQIGEFLKEFSPNVYDGLTLSRKGNFVSNVLIRKDPEDWPDEALLSRLRLLPPSVHVRVDPESLL